MGMKRAFAVALLGVVPALTGCLTRTHTVQKSHVADVVLDATLDQLVTNVNRQFDAIQTLNASVEIAASTGGSHVGQVTDTLSFSGYIFLQKPQFLRVLLLVPVIRTRALDMVSDGSTFKLLIPPKNRAVEGPNTVSVPSKNGLENLRPAVFFDSLMVRGLEPNQIVSLTQDNRILDTPDAKHKNELIEEPDYDLAILAQPEGKMVHTLRVIHIGRTNLLPYQQDIYDADGHIVTRAYYSNYQKYGDIPFPTKIVIKRPLDQYSLTLTITKLAINQKLESDQFELKIPESIPIQHVQ